MSNENKNVQNEPEDFDLTKASLQLKKYIELRNQFLEKYKALLLKPKDNPVGE